MFNRIEVCFDIDHSKMGTTPSRKEIRNAVAQKMKASLENVLIIKIETKTGTQTAIGSANIYQSKEEMEKVEPEYIMKRNILIEKEAKKEIEEVAK